MIGGLISWDSHLNTPLNPNVKSKIICVHYKMEFVAKLILMDFPFDLNIVMSMSSQGSWRKIKLFVVVLNRNKMRRKKIAINVQYQFRAHNSIHQNLNNENYPRASITLLCIGKVDG